MIFEIGNYKVEIKAHNMDLKDEKTDESTMNFLNLISLLAGEARGSYREKGLVGLERTAGKVADDVYRALKKLGLYD